MLTLQHVWFNKVTNICLQKYLYHFISEISEKPEVSKFLISVPYYISTYTV